MRAGRLHYACIMPCFSQYDSCTAATTTSLWLHCTPVHSLYHHTALLQRHTLQAVEDATFLLQKSLDRSMSTRSEQAIMAIVNRIADILDPQARHPSLYSGLTAAAPLARAAAAATAGASGAEQSSNGNGASPLVVRCRTLLVESTGTIACVGAVLRCSVWLSNKCSMRSYCRCNAICTYQTAICSVYCVQCTAILTCY
jgi:COG4 transport protein